MISRCFLLLPKPGLLPFFVLFLLLGFHQKTSAQAVLQKGVLGFSAFESAPDFLPSTTVIAGSLSKVVFVIRDDGKTGISSAEISSMLRRNVIQFRNSSIRLRPASVSAGKTTWQEKSYVYVEATVEMTALFGLNSLTTALDISEDETWQAAASSVVNIRLREVNMIDVQIIEAPKKRHVTAKFDLTLNIDRADVEFTRKDGNDVLVDDEISGNKITISAMNGRLTLENLYPGLYSIKVSSRGFQTDSLGGIKLQPENPFALTMDLSPEEKQVVASQLNFRNTLHIGFSGNLARWTVTEGNFSPEGGAGFALEISKGLGKNVMLQLRTDRTNVSASALNDAYQIIHTDFALSTFLIRKPSRFKPYLGAHFSQFQAKEKRNAKTEIKGRGYGLNLGGYFQLNRYTAFQIGGWITTLKLDEISSVTMNSQSLGNRKASSGRVFTGIRFTL